MRSSWIKLVIGSMVALACAGVSNALTIDEAIELAGDRLVGDQKAPGLEASGSWSGSEGFTGSIIAGLASAHEATGKLSYKLAAQAAGQFVLDRTAFGTPEFIQFLGDEAYGLTRLSDLAADPGDNAWRDAVSGFLGGFPDEDAVNQFIDDLLAFYLEDSVSLFYLAHFAVAAEYVDDSLKGTWRQGALDVLGILDNDDAYPVMGLGTAVWALAQTGGGLDATTIGGTWGATTLADLPDILASHQVPVGSPYAGSFYWGFDHLGSDLDFESGYVQDTVYAALGLDAAGGHDNAVTIAQQALSVGVDEVDGDVFDHICDPVAFLYAFGGEILRALAAAVPANPMLIAAKSRHAHGLLGDFDVDLPIHLTCTGAGVEPRVGGAKNFILEFDSAIALDCANIDLASGSCVSAADLGGGTTWEIKISGPPANACNVLGIVGVPLSGATQIQVYSVRGDINGDLDVDVQDMSKVKGKLFHVVNAWSFRRDINRDGEIDVVDMSNVKGNLFAVVAPCP